VETKNGTTVHRNGHCQNRKEVTTCVVWKLQLGNQTRGVGESEAMGNKGTIWERATLEHGISPICDQVLFQGVVATGVQIPWTIACVRLFGASAPLVVRPAMENVPIAKHGELRRRCLWKPPREPQIRFNGRAEN
jgi:hypothetical protein